MGLSDASRSVARDHDVGDAAAMAVKINKARDNHLLRTARLFDAADAPVFDDDPPRAKAFGRGHSTYNGSHRESGFREALYRKMIILLYPI